MKMDMTSDRPILRSASLAAGTRAPVLLLHGSASAAVMWIPVIDPLKSRFRVIAPDLIGYGRTDSWPDGHGFRVDDELRLLEPLLQRSDRPPLVLASGLLERQTLGGGRRAVRRRLRVKDWNRHNETQARKAGSQQALFLHRGASFPKEHVHLNFCRAGVYHELDFKLISVS